MRLIDADAIERCLVIGGRWHGKTIISEIIRRAIQSAPTVDAIPVEWIPVNERLPKDDGYYIVSCTQADVSYSSISDFIYDVDGNPQWLNEFGVVAWMPLPTPYDRKEE